MTRKPGDQEPEPPGGRAAKRLQEFIDQRFPGGLPTPESVPEQETEGGSETEAKLGELTRILQELVEAQKLFEARLQQQEQIVQQLVEAQKRIESGSEKHEGKQ